MTKSWSEFIIGVLLLISPWVLGFSDISIAKWCNVLMGVILILINAWAIFVPPLPPTVTDKKRNLKK
jgi:hypothetical protein